MRNNGNTFAGREKGRGNVTHQGGSLPPAPGKSRDRAGLKHGLSSHSKLGMHEPVKVNMKVDPVTGNSHQRVTRNPDRTTARKFGKNFTLR